VAGSCKHGDEPLGSGTMELVMSGVLFVTGVVMCLFGSRFICLFFFNNQ
jgi:hypothetical protein